MDVLCLAPEFPLPVNNGYRMRSWALWRALAAEGYRLTLVTLAPDAVTGDGRRAAGEVFARVEMAPYRRASMSSGGNYLGRLRGFVSSAAYSVERFRSPAFQAVLGRVWREGSFAAVLCDTSFLAVNWLEFALQTPGPEHAPLVLNHHNVEHMILERHLRQEHNPLKWLYAARESRKLRGWEERVIRLAAVNLVCSAADAVAFKSLAPGAQMVITPNVVDVPPEPLSEGAGSAPVLLFQGGMDWNPNRDAVSFFVKEVLPRIRERVREARLVIAGRNPAAAFVRRFAGIEGVEFTGTVASMRPFLQQAALCVVPLRVGSGTRLKILEAAAAGKAIVSTSLGAEGLQFQDGSEIALADGAGEFAAACVALLRDPARRAALGRAARQRVQRQYTLKEMQTALRQALALALNDEALRIPMARMAPLSKVV